MADAFGKWIYAVIVGFLVGDTVFDDDEIREFFGGDEFVDVFVFIIANGGDFMGEMSDF